MGCVPSGQTLWPEMGPRRRPKAVEGVERAAKGPDGMRTVGTDLVARDGPEETAKGGRGRRTRGAGST